MKNLMDKTEKTVASSLGREGVHARAAIAVRWL
jgi:hypothetical protein